MEFVGAGIFIVGGAALVGVALMAGKIARHLATHGAAVSWRALAGDRAELTFTDVGSMGFTDPVLEGKVGGVPVKVHIWDEPQGKTSRRVTVYRAELQNVLPARLRFQVEGVGWKLLQGLGLKDIEVGDDGIDDALRITSADPGATLEVMQGERTRHALRTVLRANLRVILEDRVLKLLQVGVADREIGTRYLEFVELIRALDGALSRPWSRMAEREGLSLRRSRRRTRVEGQWGGLNLTAVADSGGGGDPCRSRIQVGIPGELPRGLWITRRDEDAPAGCLDLPDPVVGHMLCVRCQRPELAVELLDDDDLRAALLEVVHGHPGSRVQGDAVVLEVDQFLGEAIEEKVAMAVNLARALGERSARLAT